jgi:hypothetical protein
MGHQLHMRDALLREGARAMDPAMVSRWEQALKRIVAGIGRLPGICDKPTTPTKLSRRMGNEQGPGSS